MTTITRQSIEPEPVEINHSILLQDLSRRDLKILRVLLNETTSTIVTKTELSMFPVRPEEHPISTDNMDIQYRLFNVVDDMLRNLRKDREQY